MNALDLTRTAAALTLTCSAAGTMAAEAFCTDTTESLTQACRAEARDDLRVAQARCLNIGDAAQRSECEVDARSDHREALQSCGEVKAWRLAACAKLGEARFDPDFTPDRFEADFDKLSQPNPYFPLVTGHHWAYSGDGETTTVDVLADRKIVEGVTCIVVRDLVYLDGRLKEATDDWFAAGKDGSTWYCGEEVKDYEWFDDDQPPRAELVSIDGSFKHGRDGDVAGTIMPAVPTAGLTYREEFSLGNAEDVADVLASGWSFGDDPELDRFVPPALAQRLCQADCLVTRNYSLQEPGQIELKYHARGIGVFLEVDPEVGAKLQLVDCNFDERCVALPAQ